MHRLQDKGIAALLPCRYPVWGTHRALARQIAAKEEKLQKEIEEL